VIDIGQFRNLRLQGGFLIREIQLTCIPMVDAIGREAVAQTSIVAGQFRVFISGGLNDDELSVTLYHEILEAATIAVDDPPAAVLDFDEGDFERAAREAHERWGNASPDNLNQLLQFHGF
jgi:hypothetical protein